MIQKIILLVLVLFILSSNAFSQSEEYFEIDKKEMKKITGRTFLALEKHLTEKNRQKYTKKDPEYVARNDKYNAAYNADIKSLIENDWNLPFPVKSIKRDELEKMSKEELNMYIIIFFEYDNVLRFRNAEMYKGGVFNIPRNNLFSVPIPNFGSRTNGIIFGTEQFKYCLNLAQKEEIYSNKKLFDEINASKGSMKSKVVLINQYNLSKKLEADVKSGEFKTEFSVEYKITDKKKHGVSFDQKKEDEVLMVVLPTGYLTHTYEGNNNVNIDEKVNFYGIFFIDSHTYKIIAVKTLGRTKLAGKKNEEKLSPKDLKGLTL